MKGTKERGEFWIQNRSKMNVSVRDLAVTIPAGTTINLLGNKYPFTEQQLEESLQKGSLFEKRRVLVKVFGKPQDPPQPFRENFNASFNRKPFVKPVDPGQYPIFEELDVGGNELARLLDQEAEDEDEEK